MKILEMAKIQAKELLTYKFEFFIWLVTIPIMLAIYYFLWKAIFAYTGDEVIKGFTFPALISYYVLTQLVGGFTGGWIANSFSYDIRYGGLISNLVLPINFFFYKLSNLVGQKIFLIFIQTLPVLVLGMIFFNLKINRFFPFFVASLILATLLNFILFFCIGLSAFWFKENIAFLRIFWITDNILSGAILPLAFFPKVLQSISLFLPFQYSLYIPINIFLGKYSFFVVFKMLFIQVFWIALMFAVWNFLWKKGIKKFEAVGV